MAPSSHKGFVLILSGLILFFFFIYAYLQKPLETEHTLPGFESRLLSELDGWKIEDLPLAESPELLNRINQILKFDEAIYRTYEKERLVIGVYAAYWLPQNKDFDFIHNHVPDVCWVSSGWDIIHLKNEFLIETDIGSLLPGQFRTMNKKATDVDLLYWILLNGEVFEYVKNGAESNKLSFKERIGGIIDRVNPPNGEGRFFIRVSSNESIEEIKDDPGFQSILQSVAEFGLYEKDQS